MTFNYVHDMHVSVCGNVNTREIPEEARGGGFPGAGVRGRCELTVWILGTKFRSSIKQHTLF